MTKQEEIREELILKTGHRAIAYDILRYLHSQGVLIKVRCPDCEWSQFKDEVVGMTPCHPCNSTGYTIKPLIIE